MIRKLLEKLEWIPVVLLWFWPVTAWLIGLPCALWLVWTFGRLLLWRYGYTIELHWGPPR